MFVKVFVSVCGMIVTVMVSLVCFMVVTIIVIVIMAVLVAPFVTIVLRRVIVVLFLGICGSHEEGQEQCE
jgi:hypothetical protein